MLSSLWERGERNARRWGRKSPAVIFKIEMAHSDVPCPHSRFNYRFSLLSDFPKSICVNVRLMKNSRPARFSITY